MDEDTFSQERRYRRGSGREWDPELGLRWLFWDDFRNWMLLPGSAFAWHSQLRKLVLLISSMECINRCIKNLIALLGGALEGYTLSPAAPSFLAAVRQTPWLCYALPPTIICLTFCHMEPAIQELKPLKQWVKIHLSSFNLFFSGIFSWQWKTNGPHGHFLNLGIISWSSFVLDFKHSSLWPPSYLWLTRKHDLPLLQPLLEIQSIDLTKMSLFSFAPLYTSRPLITYLQVCVRHLQGAPLTLPAGFLLLLLS